MKMGSAGAAVAVMIAVATAGCGSSSETEGATDDTVKVGLSASFSGQTAFYGQQAIQGAKIAEKELNGKAGGPKWEVVQADDQCTPAGGGSAFGRLIDSEGVDVVLGSTCSSATLGGMPLLPRSQVPGMTQASTSADISAQSGEGGNQFMWRMNLDDESIARTWAKAIAEQDVATIAILAVDNDFGRGAAGVYEEQFGANQVRVASTQFYTQGGGDYRSQLTKVKSARPDALMIIGEANDGALIFRQMREIGLKLKVFARGNLVSAEFQKAAEDDHLGDGLQEASYWAPGIDPELEAAFEKTYPNDVLTYNAALTYYGMMTLAAAVEAGGTDAAGIQRGLREVRAELPIGPIEFDAHHQAHPDLYVLSFVDGRIKLIRTLESAQ